MLHFIERVDRPVIPCHDDHAKMIVLIRWQNILNTLDLQGSTASFLFLVLDLNMFLNLPEKFTNLEILPSTGFSRSKQGSPGEHFPKSVFEPEIVVIRKSIFH